MKDCTIERNLSKKTIKVSNLKFRKRAKVSSEKFLFRNYCTKMQFVGQENKKML